MLILRRLADNSERFAESEPDPTYVTTRALDNGLIENFSALSQGPVCAFLDCPDGILSFHDFSFFSVG